MPLTNRIRINKKLPSAFCIFKLRKINFFSGLLGIALSLFTSPILAQQHSYDPNTDNDGGKQAYDCRDDIRRFCDGPGILLFEQENCLQRHMGELKPACRQHLRSTDFKKYYHSEDHLLGF